ncbi:DUF3971 domain-containing protein [Lichenihabitans sp. Uapishka_5]|uniref:YhdP family protein n=1 Tax=Lichenihabitans sp. Uapishka_5 TaxID=3037302 RepID=UPI0029E7D45D|nr:DUF3971 domain-containing protein [Lichenihabitans sp. Uapishka_5]MDX7950044.1 DUF3971 domain-containing protein [Lichenihabitans sp. Uapishka_5]
MVDHTDDLTTAERSTRLRGGNRGTAPGLSQHARRLCLAWITFAITIVFCVAAGLGLVSLRLAHGPINLSMLQSPVLTALEGRLRPGFKVAIDGVDLEAVDGKPAVAVRQMLVRDEAGRPIFRAPRAVVSFDPLHLLAGSVVPTRLDVRDVVLRLTILPDGTAALSAGTDDSAPLRLSDAMSSLSQPSGGTAAGAPETDARKTDTAIAVPPAPLPVDRFAAALSGLIDRFGDVDQSLSGFARFGVSEGTLILDDRTHGSVTTFRNLDLQFQKTGPTASLLTVAADGAQGRWFAHLRGGVEADQRRSLAVAVGGITLDDLRAIPSLREVGIDTDLALSADVSLGLDAAGKLTVARGRVATEDGFVHLHDPDHEPLFLSGSDATFHYDPAANAVLVDQVHIKAETATYDLAGRIAPPMGNGPMWTLNLDGSGIFGAERPNEKPLSLASLSLAARYDTEAGRLLLDGLRLRGPEVDLKLVLDVQHTATGILVKGGATAGRMSAPAMLRLWPTTVAADVRAWLLVNLQGGTVDSGTVSFALDDDDLAKMKAMRSVADSHLRVDYAVSDVTLGFMAGVPPLRKASGHGSVTGDTSRFNVDSGSIEVSPGRLLAVSAGSLDVPSTDPKPSPATIALHVEGGLDTLADLLSRDTLKPYADVPADLAAARGKIAGDLTVGLKIGNGANPKDTKVAATAQVSDLVIDKLVGKQSLTDGQVDLVLDKAGFRVKGEARLFGAATQIDVRKPAGTGTGDATVVLTLDDAARAKAGFSLGKQLTGPIAAKVTMPLGDGERRAIAVDLDLTKASIANLVPGLVKPSGRAARATMTVTPTGNGVTVDAIACDIGNFSLRGSASLGQDGDFQSAHFTQVRLSPGDDMRLDATGGSDGLKLVVHGANIDARPFLKNLTGSGDSADGTKALDLELHSAVLTGQNSQALTGVDLRVVKRDGQVRRLQLNGKFGRAPFDIKSTYQGRELLIDATSGDAGATLAFFDLYKKVGSGKLSATIHLSETKFDGYATVHDFLLRDDVAMKRLTEEGLSQDRKGAAQIDPSNIAFSKLYVIFTKAGSRMNIKEGGMFGPQMGATVQGWIDLGANKLQLGGTYVPAYGVNNLFSQIPVFGPILGGGSHEGLFGINFKLNGSTDAPNLTVDPLSALAPGFLRKIFGAITDATQESAAPTLGRQQSVPDTVDQ